MVLGWLAHMGQALKVQGWMIADMREVGGYS